MENIKLLQNYTEICFCKAFLLPTERGSDIQRLLRDEHILLTFYQKVYLTAMLYAKHLINLNYYY